eukprot:5890202-Prymnesium_polylepis.1
MSSPTRPSCNSSRTLMSAAPSALTALCFVPGAVCGVPDTLCPHREDVREPEEATRQQRPVRSAASRPNRPTCRHPCEL